MPYLTAEEYAELEAECLVYIIELSMPFHHARYYVGYTHKNRFKHRMWQHLHGQGSRMLRAAAAVGITFKPIIVFEGKAWRFERRIKNRKNTPKAVDQIKRTGRLYGVRATFLKGESYA